jgi:hypothetical protein
LDKRRSNHLEELRRNHVKRLEVLESKAAYFGVSTPPHVLIEIKDIQEKIAKMDDELENNKLETISEHEKITILFLSADPINSSRLRLGEELREIQDKLKLSSQNKKFILETRMSVRPSDITQALLELNPQIVHFSAHGTNEGELCIEDLNGKLLPVSKDALLSLFTQFSDSVNCVLLNACFSDIQAEAIAENIKYVIGMKKEIGDRAAISFSIGFYQALGAGKTIPEAFELGIIQIRLQGISEHMIPTLLRKL